MNDDRIETYDARELWMHGLSEDHSDSQCPNCGSTIDVERLEPPEDDQLLTCPDCAAELPWTALEDVPVSGWFNWACLQKVEYRQRECFDEPDQEALRLDVSVADPRGSDVGIEITRDRCGVVLVKIENRESLTYYPHAGSEVEGSYTVARFEPR